MIRGYCKTNLDEYQRENWPRMFASLPREGDWMQAESGKVLRVCTVTHCEVFAKDSTPYLGRTPISIGDPYIIVELTKVV